MNRLFLFICVDNIFIHQQLISAAKVGALTPKLKALYPNKGHFKGFLMDFQIPQNNYHRKRILATINFGQKV